MSHETKSGPTPKHGSKAPITDLVGDLKDEFVHLFRATTQLLRVELTENVENASTALVRTMTGFAVAATSALMLLLGIDLLLIDLLAPDVLSYATAAWVVTLGLASLLGIIGAILVKRAKRDLRAEKLIPDRTLATFEEHAEWIARKAEDLKK